MPLAVAFFVSGLPDLVRDQEVAGSNPVSPTDFLDDASLTNSGICDKSQMPFLFSPRGSGGHRVGNVAPALGPRRWTHPEQYP